LSLIDSDYYNVTQYFISDFISDKSCFLFNFLFIKKEATKLFSTLIRNISGAANKHIRIISEKS